MGKLGCGADGNLDDADFSKPMPWIGVYVAAASLFCGLGMAVDLIHGFRHKKFWFPSMPSSKDQLAKLSSSVFICTVMGNSMPSLGIMQTNDLFMNIMALGILVVTLIVNICIQLGTGAIYVFWKQHAFIMFLMIIMLMILGFSALTVPTTKQYLDHKYKKKYELALKECPCKTERKGIMSLKEDLMKLWMMAHTSTPQFVMARSVTCTASGFLCLLSALTLAQAMVQTHLFPNSPGFCRGSSDYKWSTTLVLVTQAAAIAIGTVAPAIRWFTAVNFRCPTIGEKFCKKEFQVEGYWIQSLIEKKECPLSTRIQSQRGKKLAHDLKSRSLELCIAIQCAIVFSSKVIRFISVYLVSRILICCHLCKKLTRFKSRESVTNNDSGSESNPSTKLDLTRFVLHLEGEDELIKVMMRSNREATETWIQKGKQEEPKHLIELLETRTLVSRGFQGIRDFDSDEVPSLDKEEPPNCWALPLATLTCIAVALPNVNPCLVKKLLNSLNEGFGWVKKVDRFLDLEGNLTNIRKAADIVWLGVDLYHKWLDVDLHKLSRKEITTKEILLELADVAKKRFFESNQMNILWCLKNSPSKWPIKMLAANSMYRICQTILLNYEANRNYQSSEELFEALRVMISDIISGCLSNIPHIISIKCLVTAVEKREESVRGAALHLGAAEKILEIIENRCVPGLPPDRITHIDMWRSFYKLNSPPQSCTPSSSSSSSSEDDTFPMASNKLVVSIE